MDAPQVRVHQWIRIGTSGTSGLVLHVSSDGSIAVGYYQNGAKAIKEDVVWKHDRWEFATSGPSGSYLRGAEEAMVKRGPSGSDA